MNKKSDLHRTDRRRLLASGAGFSAGLLALGCTARAPAPATSDLTASDELFADLSDERASVAPITAAERAARRARLARLLAERGLDAFMCEGGATLTYLAGVSWGRSERLFALVVTADGAHFWLVPAFEEERARLAIEGAAQPEIGRAHV